MKQIKVQKVTHKIVNKEVITPTQGEQHIKVEAGYLYELEVEKDKIKDVEQVVDEDLKITLKDGTVIIFDNYFEICKTDLSCLVSVPDENGVHYAIDITSSTSTPEIGGLATNKDSAMTYLLPFLGLGLGLGGGSTGSEGGNSDKQLDIANKQLDIANKQLDIANKQLDSANNTISELEALNDELVANGGSSISKEEYLSLISVIPVDDDTTTGLSMRLLNKMDSLYVYEGSDPFIGNESNEAVIGASRHFSYNLQGGGGADILFTRGGDDHLEGGAGDDILISGHGTDTVNLLKL